MNFKKTVLTQQPKKLQKIGDRFWSKVHKGVGCWSWQGARCRDGYGCIRVAGHTLSAHRVSWVLATGKSLASRNHVLHTCDNPRCVRPSHLFLGSHSDNMNDMAQKGRARGVARRGVDNPAVRLLEKDVRAIRKQRSAGATYRELGARFGVNPATAWHVVNQTWSHL